MESVCFSGRESVGGGVHGTLRHHSPSCISLSGSVILSSDKTCVLKSTSSSVASTRRNGERIHACCWTPRILTHTDPHVLSNVLTPTPSCCASPSLSSRSPSSTCIGLCSACQLLEPGPPIRLVSTLAQYSLAFCVCMFFFVCWPASLTAHVCRAPLSLTVSMLVISASDRRRTCICALKQKRRDVLM